MSREGKKSVSRRGKNLSDDAIEQIVRVLDEWTGALTWDLLIDALVLRLGFRYTRQALHRHVRIKSTFALRKAALARQGGREVRHRSDALTEALNRAATLDAENKRLEEENRRLLEQFVLWAYNAHTRGLDEEFLSQPLPRVDRGQTLSSIRGKNRQARR